MGMDPFTIGLIASTGLSILGGMRESEAATQQSRAQQGEIQRQQVETTRGAQEQKSDRAIAADRDFAQLTVAMETLGGAGSQNEARLGREIHGIAALDLARIEGNRRREVEALQSQSIAAARRAKAAKTSSQFQALGSVVDLGGGLAGRSETQAAQSRQEDLARGRTPLPLS